ncbi:phosphodiesterase [Leptospira gomenensis]|uniref:Phosphodiesterase n=1 Tax=Leptospira gomenensis TaxID=2484974 RepID=A0A5F1YSL3_9LEPT|nr:GGDEF domain-containing phosphodiesterase [Leptospira gomenensis]TGK31689.1 phosphodiesterase [Leptospira gomenensis]TGK41682.1 phosphodiesterase [Leptospira gomenensis]TGK43364.1 phosphodiesterase [Leptospira gomenensis]TGK61358.1 phosphodiesterase [Leptospira gomenensis]
MTDQNLGLYETLSKIKPLKSYTAKILLVAFLGTHVPLIALLTYYVVQTGFDVRMIVQTLVVALIATLGGTGATLFALHKLLTPITLTSHCLKKYLSEKVLPNLPTNYTDEAGTLMAGTALTVRKLDEVINYLSNYDPLTSLPNRDYFVETIYSEIKKISGSEGRLFVVSVGIQRWKEIKNTFGNHASDIFLRFIGKRIGELGNDAIVLARSGEGEFSLLFSSETGNDFGCEKTVIDILEGFKEALPIAGNELYVGINAGIARYPEDGTASEQLLWKAEAALNGSLTQGTQYSFFTPELNDRIKEKLTLEKELRDAIAKDQFSVVYQPKVNLKTGALDGMEALVRWNHPQSGIVSPLQFIPMAEETGLIVELGELVLRKACTDLQNWKRKGLPGFRVSVNLSAIQFRKKFLTESVLNILEETNTRPEELELEITESALAGDPISTLEVLHSLHQSGITLSLDDFGTGYSSLSSLSQYPIHTLKIDQSFVKGLNEDPANDSIIKTILALAESLNLKTIAEGIESERQKEILALEGCESGQGYLFSKPLPIELLEDFARNLRSPDKLAVDKLTVF